MHQPDDRRGFLQRVAIGATVVAGASALDASGALAAAVDAEKKGRNHKQPTQFFKGRLSNIVYTPVGSGDTPNYLITATGQGGDFHDRRKHRTRHLSDAQLANYINKRNQGAMNGCQCLYLEGIVWRLQTVSYDDAANQWSIMARVCDSNEHARPSASPAAPASEGGSPAYGCGCGCYTNCYRCDNGQYSCGYSVDDAC